MTTAFILTALATVFVIGFLLGDRRGVKQCNAILDENWRELMKTIKEESPLAEPTETDKAVPTLH